MITEELMANYTPAVDIASFIFCCILIFVIAKVLFFSSDRKFILLKRALCCITAASFLNILFYVVVTHYGEYTKLIFLIRDLYHVSLMMSMYCFILYMKHMIDIKKTVANIIKYVTRVMFTVCLVFEFLSPVTKFGFYIENGLWTDPVFGPYTIIYIFSFLLLLLLLVFYSNRLIRYVRICLGVTALAIGGIMIYQGFLDINTYTCFTYMLPVFIVMILLHSKPYDEKTGALDSTSFDSYVKQSSKLGIPIDYVVLKLNINILDTLPDELGKVLNSFWHDSFKNALSFKLASDIFVLVVPREKANGNTEEKISKLINVDLQENYQKYRIPYKLIGIFNVTFIENLTDILGITKYLLLNMEENSITILDDKRKEEHRIMKKVKENLADIEAKSDYDDPRVLVYYQPVRNMKTGQFDTAEALMRLKLDGAGIVQPYMFITMAEEYGYITTLTKIMLNKVCNHIKQMDGEGYVFKRISVNVSAVDMKIDGFCEELINVVRENNVPFSKIGIELTESQTDKDFRILKNKMKILHDAGFALYLDDVGTGYSNLDRIVQYDVDVVKFDRFFLLEAENSMKIIKMMTHLSQAFQDLEYKLLFEGVETEAHEVLCKTCSADFIQGFKYSKPIPFEEFKIFLAKSKEEINPLIDDKVSIKQDFSYKEIKDQNNVLIAMSKLFYSMHIIDLEKNTARPYNPTEDIKVVDVVNSPIGADQMMKQIMRMCTVDEHVDAVLEFTDLKTIQDRMINKRILSAEYIGKSIGWYVASFYTIEADNNGRPTKVVFTTRSIDEEKKQKEK